MEGAEFLRWRKKLGYAQQEAGKQLGVSRGTIDNWEKGITRIPRAVELGCVQIFRRWRRRPEFGPVNLTYTDGPIWQELRDTYCCIVMQCEFHETNEAALQRACELEQNPNVVYRFVLTETGELIWSGADLVRECARRRNDGDRSKV